MKAAVLHSLGSIPKFETFSDPVITNEHQLLITVKAASVKNLDKMRASGAHYASYTELPVIVGIDGVGVLEDGTRVYAQGISGMMAEKALILKTNYIILPDGLDNVTAAALPNALIGAALALRYRAELKAGDTVLINGATGVTGKIAVQAAKYYGASKIIVTGRNPQALRQLVELGADDVIALTDSDETIIEKIKKIHELTPINSVMDYLWGHPMELILKALKSTGLNTFTPVVRIVTVGEMAGSTIHLSSSILRSSAINIMGSGIGSLSKEAMHKYITEILPEMFQLAADGKLRIDTETERLEDIEQAWLKVPAAGKRLVITIGT